MFDKIYNSMKRLITFALFLTVALILAVFYALIRTNIDHSIFIHSLLICSILAACLVWIISSKIALAVTKQILEPLNRAATEGYAETEEIYDEIKPLLSRLTTKDGEIKRQSDKAKSQKLQLKTVTSNMNEGLIILDQNGNVLAINHCAQDILGVAERDIKYRHFLSLPDSKQFAHGLKTAADGKNTDLRFSTENEKAYQMFFTPVFENNLVCGIVILLFDVSEKYRLEQIRREFSANVSHELKTPLTTIFGYSQIITNGIAKPEDIKGFAEKIEKESARLITLIDDIIALSDLEEKGASIEKETFSLRPLAEEVLESLEPRAKEQGILLTLSGEDTTLSANRRQIHELIYNLCDNAIKYNKPSGSVTVTISHNTLTVKDTGIGIPADSIDRLFERFYRVDKSHSKKVNGTGLGLSIVKHIVQSNNAEISVNSILGEGSTFTVVFH